MPCNPTSAMRFIAQGVSWVCLAPTPAPPHIELVVPNRMSGLTGSSGLCLMVLAHSAVVCRLVVATVAAAVTMKWRRWNLMVMEPFPRVFFATDVWARCLLSQVRRNALGAFDNALACCNATIRED